MKLFGLVGQAHASGCTPGEGGVDLGNCLRLANETPVSSVYNNPAVLVNLIVKNLFVVAGVLIFMLILYAGFKFVQSGPDGKQDAQKILTSAVVGAIVMFSAYWIVQIIGVVTGIDMGL